MTINFYGLLHLDEGEYSAVNVSLRDFQDQINVYVNCAINLSNSLQLKGIAYTLLTNKKNVLDTIVQSEQKTLQIKEIPFDIKVPHGARFYSAHFIIDVFRFLSTLNEDYVGVCDLDMVCINDFPQCLSNNIKQKIPMCYDISDQVIPAYGHEVVIRDLEMTHGLDSEGRWTGGELLLGTPEFFFTLLEESNKIFGNYINNLGKFHHIGNETLISATLEIMRKKGIYIADAGTLGIVGRFWNTETLHPQKPLDYFQQCFLLHLPSDKRFLADMAKENIVDYSGFMKLYKDYIRVTKTKPNKINKLYKRIARLLIKIRKKFKHRFQQSSI